MTEGRRRRQGVCVLGRATQEKAAAYPSGADVSNQRVHASVNVMQAF